MQDKTLQWRDQWSIDISSVDQEHKLLINIFNDLVAAVEGVLDQQTARDCFQDFADHSKEHFSHEELIMRNIGFGKYREHKSEHDIALERAGDIQDVLNGDFSVETARQLCDELRTWLMDHITNFDTSIRDHIQYGR